MEKWLQLLVTGITMGSIYALIALGFVTIYRTSRIVNMAQGSFVMFGALFAYTFLREIGLPFWLAAIIGVVITVAIAVVMYVVVLKPIMKVSLGAMILFTVALSLLFENLALLQWGGYGQGLPSFTGDQSFNIGGVYISRQSLWVIGIMIIVLVALYFLNNHTTTGKRMTATAPNPVAASLSGVSVTTMIILAFVISAVIGALGGISIAWIVPISCFSGGIFGLNGFVAAVLGGWGSSTGAVVGGLLLGIIQSLTTGVFPAGYKNVVSFIILIVVLYFRPQGLLGTRMTEGEA